MTFLGAASPERARPHTPAGRRPPASRRPAPGAQQGVAAIEFSIVALTFLILFYGVVTFGAALYTKQAVSRAANDGARAAAVLPALAANDVRVQRVIYESLAGSLIAPDGDTAQRLAWLRAHVALPTVDVSDPLTARVSVSYPYRDNPMLPALPLTDAWMPTSLLGQAVAPRLAGG